MTDTFRWNTKTAVAGHCGNQDTSKSNPGQLDNTMRGGKID
jgi:hypothetical protein